MEFFRSELAKSEYLFSSLTTSASIGSATLNSITVKPLFDPNFDQIPSNTEDLKHFKDIVQIKKYFVLIKILK
jgi:hypothetical protein